MKSVFPDLKYADENGIIALGGVPNTDLLLDAYARGIFPWPHPEIPHIPWVSPPMRGILFKHDFKGEKRIKRYIRSANFKFSYNKLFSKVIKECAKPINRSENSSWITQEMITAYTELHHLGHAHSLEVYKDQKLVGGLYGVSIGGSFSAESMFYRYPNASKAALLKLSEDLFSQGTNWIDCQQLTDHLSFLGGKEIPRDIFIKLLMDASIREKLIFPKD